MAYTIHAPHASFLDLLFQGLSSTKNADHIHKLVTFRICPSPYSISLLSSLGIPALMCSWAQSMRSCSGSFRRTSWIQGEPVLHAIYFFDGGESLHLFFLLCTKYVLNWNPQAIFHSSVPASTVPACLHAKSMIAACYISDCGGKDGNP